MKGVSIAYACEYICISRNKICIYQLCPCITCNFVCIRCALIYNEDLLFRSRFAMPKNFGSPNLRRDINLNYIRVLRRTRAEDDYYWSLVFFFRAKSRHVAWVKILLGSYRLSILIFYSCQFSTPIGWSDRILLSLSFSFRTITRSDFFWIAAESYED